MTAARPPEVFRAFCRGLHQDWPLMGPDRQTLAAACVGFVSDADRPALESYLAKALANLTNAELKGLLRKGGSELIFDPKGARAFLEAAMQALPRAPGRL